MFDPDSDVSYNQNGSTPRNYAKFFLHPVLNNFKTKAEGREIYESREFILIIAPGQSKSEVRRPVQEKDKKDYPSEWQAFIENKSEAVTGTPIEQLPTLDIGMAKQLKFLNIHTIEQMAAMHDAGLANIGMGAREIKTKAQAFLQKNSSEVVALRNRIAELEKKLNALSTPAITSPKKRGRKPREQSSCDASVQIKHRIVQ